MNKKTAGKRFYQKYLKRVLDIVLSFIALIVLSPLLLIVALLIRKKLGSPVIFKQERPGLNEKIFKLYKFRSMSDEKGPDGKLLPDIQRIGKFGKVLRDTSLDELPELFNILKGDMSIVGPRPLLVKYLPLYNEEQRKRHTVRPGLTGYAQVHGRNATSWEERFKYDVEYVNTVSFLLDVKIVLATVKSVFKHEGINSNTTSKYTMNEFTGTKVEEQ